MAKNMQVEGQSMVQKKSVLPVEINIGSVGQIEIRNFTLFKKLYTHMAISQTLARYPRIAGEWISIPPKNMVILGFDPSISRNLESFLKEIREDNSVGAHVRDSRRMPRRRSLA